MKVWCFSIIFLLLGCASKPAKKRSQQTLNSYKSISSICYNRSTQPYTAIVDTHLHFRPFGGSALKLETVVNYLKKSGVFFANIYGIGQRLPATSPCTYYLDCLGTPVKPSFRNDIANAENLLEWRSTFNKAEDSGIHLVLSMTFPDLSDPSQVLSGIRLLDKEYSEGLFRWMGEVNLVKQALFNNGRQAVPKSQIPKWAPFMSILHERNIPLAIHSDLGNDNNPTQYISWMEEVLRLYPNNKIVWMHAGLSKELAQMDVDQHIEVMTSFLNRSPNLMLDLSWRVLYDSYFSDPIKRDKYVQFINKYSDRILPGTDFVASSNKNFDIYQTELEITSHIYQYVSNEAFRNIALGQNYFQLIGLDYQAPPICQEQRSL